MPTGTCGKISGRLRVVAHHISSAARQPLPCVMRRTQGSSLSRTSSSSANAVRFNHMMNVYFLTMTHETAALLQPVSYPSTALVNAFAGAGAGTAATLATHPFDVLKVRHQYPIQALY